MGDALPRIAIRPLTNLCSAPMLGPSLGPILGGVLAQGFNWRAIFWFLAIFAGVCALSFIFFRETFRRERSLTYQTVLKRVLQEEANRAEEKRIALGRDMIRDSEQSARRDEEIHHGSISGGDEVNRDIEAPITAPASEVLTAVREVRLTLKDVNPFLPMVHVLYRVNNVLILSASGKHISM